MLELLLWMQGLDDANAGGHCMPMPIASGLQTAAQSLT
jgi:hypothetical protein